MTEHWQIFAALAALVAAWSLLILGVMRFILSKCVSDLDSKITGLGDVSKDYQRVERALMELKAELPVQYVRREDHIREASVLYVKIDRVSEKMDSLRKDLMNLIKTRGFDCGD